jgi:nitroreductase
MNATSLKSRIQKHLPGWITPLAKSVWSNVATLSCFASDYGSFRRFYGKPSRRDRDVDRANLIKTYHVIEKGLSLQTPRPNFGRDVRERLFVYLTTYIHRWGHDQTTRIALNVLESYCQFSEACGFPMEVERDRMEQLQMHGDAAHGCEIAGGTVDLTSESAQRDGTTDFLRMAQARHSLRNFQDKAIDPALIRRAVEIATHAPSACNRQAWHVYAFSDPAKKQAIMQAQGGSRGFGESAATLLVVASDLRCFSGPNERHQAWVDGSLFSMSLLYALQYLGLGTCPLNCAFYPWEEEKFRKLTGIPRYEPLIMVIAIGHMPRQFKVTVSTRRSVDEVLVLDTPIETAQTFPSVRKT